MSNVSLQDGELVAVYAGDAFDSNLVLMGRAVGAIDLKQLAAAYVAQDPRNPRYDFEFDDYGFARWLAESGHVMPATVRRVDGRDTNPLPSYDTEPTAPVDPEPLPLEPYFDLQGA
ncbi:hypothetical protein [Acidihalobacter aeolianus]|nr:hypothetical protein [Acidihalobacter aeolianus]